MMYFLNRAGNRYGPYTVDDVRRYIGTGNIAPEDLMEPEGGGPGIGAAALVSVPTQPAPGAAVPSSSGSSASPQPGRLSAPTQPREWQPQVATIPPGVPPPPGMDWWLVLILSLVTCTLFGYIWALIQARWVKKLDAGSRAWLYLLLCLLFLPVMIGLVGATVAAELTGTGSGEAVGVMVMIFSVVIGV